MTSQHYVIETDWQETPIGHPTPSRGHDRNSPTGPQYDADALAAALSLHARPIPQAFARRVVGTWGAERNDID